MSADGKIASANHAARPLSPESYQQHLRTLVPKFDGVMVGARAADYVLPTLSATFHTQLSRRRPPSEKRGIPTVIVSGRGSILARSALIREQPGSAIVLTTQAISKVKRNKLEKLADEVQVFGMSGVHFPKALAWLREQYGVRRLLCLGGGLLNSALCESKLVDEVIVTVRYRIFGGFAAPTLADGEGVGRLAGAMKLELIGRGRCGNEYSLVYRVVR